MTLPTLTYFSSRGRAETIRLVCAEAGVSYHERNLGVYDAVDKTPAFHALAETGVMPFGAVPLWQESDGFTLAQSDAIVRHVARTHGLYGRDMHAAARCDMVFAGVEDVRAEVRKLGPAEPARRGELRAELATVTLPRWLAHFERLLDGNGGGFVVGEAPTFADVALFWLSEYLHDNGFAAAFGSCPRLGVHFAHMAARPGLARYLASPTRFPVQRLP